MLQGLRLKLAMLVALTSVGTVVQAADDTQAKSSQIERFCLDCHNSIDWAGGLDLGMLSVDNPGRDAKQWEDAVRRLRTGSMPPAGRQRPDQQVVNSLVSSLEVRLDAAAHSGSHQSGTDAGGRMLTDIALASRLSAFLWGSVPDDALLQAAKGGQLGEPGGLDAQVRRMLADPKAKSLAADFALKWLNLGRMDEIKPDARLFHTAISTPDVRPLLKREMELFLDSVLRSDQPVTALLTADYTYLNDELAKLYGVESVKGSQFRRVTLADSRRHGLLGKGAVLMATAFPDRSSPSLRGAWILTRILGMPPYERPPGVDTLEAGVESASVRERLERHTTMPACFSCHGLMDPLGFALENFDTIGQLRAHDRATGHAIDSTGTLPDGTRFTGSDDLRHFLSASPERFAQTVTEQLMAYALGRQTDWRDMPLVRQIVRNAAKDNYRFASLVTQIVASDAFRQREAVKVGLPTP